MFLEKAKTIAWSTTRSILGTDIFCTPDGSLMSLPDRYYDVRRVTGEVTQIDVDNGRVEQAGSSFFDKAVIRVLGEKGWGIAIRN